MKKMIKDEIIFKEDLLNEDKIKLNKVLEDVRDNSIINIDNSKYKLTTDAFKLEVKSDDILFIPINIGTTSREKAKQNLTELMKLYKSVMPDNPKIIMAPHRDENKFYYPLILSPAKD